MKTWTFDQIADDLAMTDEEKKAVVKEALELIVAIGDLLAGRNPSLQGAALGELVSRWLGGHHPETREVAWIAFRAFVEELNTINFPEMDKVFRAAQAAQDAQEAQDKQSKH